MEDIQQEVEDHDGHRRLRVQEIEDAGENG